MGPTNDWKMHMKLCNETHILRNSYIEKLHSILFHDGCHLLETVRKLTIINVAIRCSWGEANGWTRGGHLRSRR
jgi:hypothetical protein